MVTLFSKTLSLRLSKCLRRNGPIRVQYLIRTRRNQRRRGIERRLHAHPAETEEFEYASEPCIFFDLLMIYSALSHQVNENAHNAAARKQSALSRTTMRD